MEPAGCTAAPAEGEAMNRHPSATASAAAPRARRREGFSTGRWYPGRPNSAAGRWVLQEIGEALGALGGILRRAGGDRPRDMRQFALDGGPQAPGAVAHQRIQARDGAFEPLHGGHQGVPAPPVVSEFDHLCHDDIMTPRSDTPSASVATEPRSAASVRCAEDPDLDGHHHDGRVDDVFGGRGRRRVVDRFDGPLIVGTVVTDAEPSAVASRRGSTPGRGSHGCVPRSPASERCGSASSRSIGFDLRLEGHRHVRRAGRADRGVLGRCRQADGEGVGDLVGGFGVISRTPLEGRLWSACPASRGGASAVRPSDRGAAVPAGTTGGDRAGSSGHDRASGRTSHRRRRADRRPGSRPRCQGDVEPDVAPRGADRLCSSRSPGSCWDAATRPGRW